MEDYCIGAPGSNFSPLGVGERCMYVSLLNIPLMREMVELRDRRANNAGHREIP